MIANFLLPGGNVAPNDLIQLYSGRRRLIHNFFFDVIFALSCTFLTNKNNVLRVECESYPSCVRADVQLLNYSNKLVRFRLLTQIQRQYKIFAVVLAFFFFCWAQIENYT